MTDNVKSRCGRSVLSINQDNVAWGMIRENYHDGLMEICLGFSVAYGSMIHGQKCKISCGTF
jgi:hypothetical protein